MPKKNDVERTTKILTLLNVMFVNFENLPTSECAHSFNPNKAGLFVRSFFSRVNLTLFHFSRRTNLMSM